ncbi:hypothetical protein [Thalassotalea atypica]|uniref:hypothetical protein n=1 Tax=Thalassotalea atypica TaxID=2054316 RepID=UPI0025732470|nr:hypothetical protein [Thalassotalea atypica]
MNKLAVLAFTMLAILGGLLWYVAGSSLNPYLAQYGNEINKTHPDLSIAFGLTEINNQQGIASTSQFILAPSAQSLTPRLQLDNIRFNYDPKSFKKDAVAIKLISIESATLSLSKNNALAELAPFNELLLTIVEQTKLAGENSGITGKNEPKVHIIELTINTLHVTLFEGGEPQQEQIFQGVKITPTLQQGIISMAFTQLNIDIIEHASHLLATSEL